MRLHLFLDSHALATELTAISELLNASMLRQSVDILSSHQLLVLSRIFAVSTHDKYIWARSRSSCAVIIYLRQMARIGTKPKSYLFITIPHWHSISSSIPLLHGVM